MSIGESIGEFLSRGKDAWTSNLAESFLKQKIEPYGQMLNFAIDSREKCARIELLLKGETESVTVKVERYEVQTEGEQSFVVIRKASASREWMNVLIQNFALGQRVAIPPKYASIVKMLV